MPFRKVHFEVEFCRPVFGRVNEVNNVNEFSITFFSETHFFYFSFSAKFLFIKLFVNFVNRGEKHSNTNKNRVNKVVNKVVNKLFEIRLC